MVKKKEKKEKLFLRFIHVIEYNNKLFFYTTEYISNIIYSLNGYITFSLPISQLLDILFFFNFQAIVNKTTFVYRLKVLKNQRKKNPSSEPR